MAGLPYKHTPSRVTQGVLPPVSSPVVGGHAMKPRSTHPLRGGTGGPPLPASPTMTAAVTRGSRSRWEPETTPLGLRHPRDDAERSRGTTRGPTETWYCAKRERVMQDGLPHCGSVSRETKVGEPVRGWKTPAQPTLAGEQGPLDSESLAPLSCGEDR